MDQLKLAMIVGLQDCRNLEWPQVLLSNKKESFSLESILESEEKYNLCVWKFYQNILEN